MADVDKSTFLWWNFRLGDCDSLKLNNVTLGYRGAAALARALKGNKQLTELKLERCALGAAGIRVLASSLESTIVEKLDVEANAIGFEGAVALAESIPSTRIRELDVEDNEILDGGAIAFAKTLSHRRSSPLESLDLENNAIGNAGMASLASALRRNRALQELDLHGNTVGVQALRSLVAAMRVNRKLGKLSLPDPGMMLSLRTRRHQAVMLRLLEKLVAANAKGATRKAKMKVLHRARRHERKKHRGHRRPDPM